MSEPTHTFAEFTSELSDNITNALIQAYREIDGYTSNKQVARILEVLRTDVNKIRDAAIKCNL